MGTRRKAREYALQMLFQWDITRDLIDTIAVSFWANIEEPPAVKEFAQKNGIPYSILMAGGDVQASYGVRAYPTTFLIDRTGVIRSKFVGTQEYDVLETALKPLLSSTPGTPPAS